MIIRFDTCQLSLKCIAFKMFQVIIILVGKELSIIIIIITVIITIIIAVMQQKSNGSSECGAELGLHSHSRLQSATPSTFYPPEQRPPHQLSLPFTLTL